MMNRTVIIILPLLLFCFFLPLKTLAYELSTHKLLTEEAIRLFNKRFPNKAINEKMGELVTKGSLHEDDSPRWLYHFYDPVNNQGLKIGPKKWLSAKQWSQNGKEQASLNPNSLFVGLLPFAFSSEETNFTWQKALRYYADGDKEQAFYSLGHVLHLLQDQAVPAHTRNDPHGAGDPYENFSKTFGANNLPAVGKPVVLNSLDDYFDNLSSYTNKNFYSKDSIGVEKYAEPKRDEIEFNNGYQYGIKKDELGDYFLYRNSGKNVIFANRNDVTVDAPEVLSGHWKRLSGRAIEFGAGLLALFYKEVGENLGNIEPLPKKEVLSKEFINNSTNLFAKASSILDGFSTTTDNKIVSKATSTIKAVANLLPIVSVKKILATSTSEISNNGVGGADPLPPVAVAAPAADRVVISEFLFDAEGVDMGKEFIEIYNPTDQIVDLTGWSLQMPGKKKNFDANVGIKPRSFFLVWLGNNTDADMLWKSGSLKNSADTIYLVNDAVIIDGDSDPNIVDKVAYSGDSFADFIPGNGLERNIWRDGRCFLGQGVGDLLGNVCASGKIETDFFLNKFPNPQSGGAIAITVKGDDKDSITEKAGPLNHLKNLNFYKDPNRAGSFLVDIFFNQYPLIEGSVDRWKILAFYKDSDPADQQFIDTNNNWLPKADNLLFVTYPNYAGDASRSSLILPDIAENFGSQGGINNSAFNYGFIEDNIIHLRTDERAQYLTIAFYDFYSSGGGLQTFELKLADKTKYFFQEQAPNYQPPVMGGDLDLIFDKGKNTLEIKWPEATDADSRDSLIRYELLVNGLKTETAGTNHVLTVAPGDEFEIVLKAKDEFNNYSEAKAANWSYPESQLVFNQNQLGGWGNNFGSKNPNCPTCESSLVSQKIDLGASIAFNFTVVKIRHTQGGWPADLRLRIYPDKNGQPDMDNLLASKTVVGVLNPNPEKDFAFVFNQEVVLGAGSYWLVLDVERYSDHRAFFQSFFQNAISVAGEWYLKLGSF